MTSTNTPTVAFFGATGPCALTCLYYTLRVGINAVAHARTPSKLRSQLLAAGLDEATLSHHLTIIQGNALDITAVKATLTAGGPNTLVDLIISGLGGAPSMQFNWRAPLQLFSIDDEHICENGARTLLNALSEVYREAPSLASIPSKKPLVIFISTTGISRGPEDVPFWIRFLYHNLLAVPHIDKRRMEAAFRNNADGTDGDEKVIRNVVGVRPTLLFGTSDLKDRYGLDAVRAGTEQKPAQGYSIRRVDVGEWIFRNLVENADTRRKWEGEMVSLTS